LDFAYLVLEALERGKLAFVDHDVVAHQAHARTTANDALGDAATGDLADLGDVEHFQDLGVAQEFFADFRREHTREHRFDVVHHVVDDVVVADFDAVSARTFAGLRVRTHVEADDRRSRRLRQDHVGFGDAADARLQRLHRHFVGAELFERALDGFDRTLHVRLDDERQQTLLAFAAGLQQLVERLARGRLLALLAALAGAVFGDFAGTRVGFHDDEFVACFRRCRETQHFHRNRRTCAFDGFAAIVDQRTHAAPFRSRDEDVALFQRAALHEHGCDRAAALVELGFDHRTFGGAVRICLQVEDFGLQQDRFFQLVEVDALGGRHFDGERFAAQVFDLDFVLEKFGLHPHRVGVAFVDLVDGDDDRNMRRFGVRDGFDGLRHDAVIGGNHKHHEIGHFRAARTHRGEGRVAWRVEEGDLLAAFQRHLVGADMLRDAARFARHHVGLAQRIEQRGLAVVDMAHDGDDRRTRDHRLGRIVGTFQTFEHVGFGDALDGVAVFGGHEFGGVGVDRVVDRRHDAVLHQHLDDVDGTARHAVGEFGNGDRFGNRHFAGACGTG